MRKNILNNTSPTTLKSMKAVRALLLSLCVIFSLSILSACGLQGLAKPKTDNSSNTTTVTADFAVEYDGQDAYIKDFSSSSDDSALKYKWAVDNKDVKLDYDKDLKEYYYYFTTGGKHTIQLTVSTKSAKLTIVDTVAYTIDLDKKAKSTAAFSVKWDGKKVALTSSSTCEGNGSMTYRWLVDNKSIATAKDASHTFNDNSTHAVQLIVTAYSKETSAESKLLDAKASSVLMFCPFANFSYAVDGRKVKFTNKTTIEDNSSMDYSWEIDNVTVTLDNSSYTFKTDGNKTIKLTAVRNDNKSFSNSVTKNINITTTAPAKDIPEADFIFKVSELEVGFTDKSIVKDNSPLKYKWLINSENIILQNPTYFFKTRGDKVVTLTVSRTDNESISNSITRVVTLTAPDAPADPEPDFTYQLSPTSVVAPWIVIFKNETKIADNSSLTYEWKAEDKIISTADNPTYTFATIGAKEVTLTATRKDGKSSISITKTIQITAPADRDYPKAEFTMTANALKLTFTNNSTVPDNSELLYKWEIDDKVLNTKEIAPYTFDKEGYRTITLTVSRADNSNYYTKIARVVYLYTDPTKHVIIADFSVNYGDHRVYGETITNVLDGVKHSYQHNDADQGGWGWSYDRSYSKYSATLPAHKEVEQWHVVKNEDTGISGKVTRWHRVK